MTTFNAITYSNKLVKSGVNRETANVQAEELSNIINNDLATKSFVQEKLEALEFRLQGFIVRTALAIIGLLGGIQTIIHFIKV